MRPNMTINEICEDMRRNGYPITQKTLSDGIAGGAFPFGKVIKTGTTGRRTFVILRRDYENWKSEYLGGN